MKDRETQYGKGDAERTVISEKKGKKTLEKIFGTWKPKSKDGKVKKVYK